MGIDYRDTKLVEELCLDQETLKEQEEILVREGNVEENEKKTAWTDGEEGYYYFLEQMTQGLPIFQKQNTADMNENEVNTAIEIYNTPEGIKYLSAMYLFDIKLTEQKIQLASFDKIKETIDGKYGKMIAEEPLVVKKCELVEYPLDIGKNQYQVIPVWLCTIAMQCVGTGEDFEQNIYLPINAVTGEEVFEMEGV